MVYIRAGQLKVPSQTGNEDGHAKANATGASSSAHADGSVASDGHPSKASSSSTKASDKTNEKKGGVQNAKRVAKNKGKCSGVEPLDPDAVKAMVTRSNAFKALFAHKAAGVK